MSVIIIVDCPMTVMGHPFNGLVLGLVRDFPGRLNITSTIH